MAVKSQPDAKSETWDITDSADDSPAGREAIFSHMLDLRCYREQNLKVGRSRREVVERAPLQLGSLD